MTFRNQNFEGGTNGATLTTSNAAGTGNTNFTTVNIPSGGLTFDTAHASQGTLALKFAPTSGATLNCRYTGMSTSSFATSFYIYLTALGSADLFLSTATAGGSTSVRAMLSNGTKLRFQGASSTVLWTATNNFPINQWVRVEWYNTVNATTANVTMAYYLGDSTSPVETNTVSNGNTGSTAIDTIIYGKTDSSTYTTPFWYDGIQSSDTATGLLGPWPAPASGSVRPSGTASNPDSWTNVGGAASIAAALGDEDDSTYTQSPDNPSNSAIVESFPTLAAGDVTVKSTNWMSLASPPMTRKLELLQGPGPTYTVVSSRTVPLTTVPTPHSWTTSSTETATITDRTQLAVRVTDTI